MAPLAPNDFCLLSLVYAEALGERMKSSIAFSCDDSLFCSDKIADEAINIKEFVTYTTSCTMHHICVV